MRYHFQLFFENEYQYPHFFLLFFLECLESYFCEFENDSTENLSDHSYFNVKIYYFFYHFYKNVIEHPFVNFKRISQKTYQKEAMATRWQPEV